MRSFLFKSVVSFFLSVVLFQPGHILAADSAIKVDRGDIVWSESDGSRSQVHYSTFSAEKNEWTAPIQITDDDYRNGHPTIDAGPDGKKLLAWVAGSGANYKLHYAVGAEGAWSETAEIPSSLKVNLAPSVMIDDSGQKWVVWSGNDGGQDEIYFSRFIGGKWTAPALVNAPNEVPDVLPEIVLNENKVPQVTWIGFRNGGYVKLQSTWDGKNWTPEKEIENSSPDKAARANASIDNMPSFVQQPDKAFVRIYKFSALK